MRCEAFRHAEDFSDVAMSPDGEKVAYILRTSAEDVGHFSYRTCVVSVDHDGVGERRSLGTGFRSSAWSSDGSLLVLARPGEHGTGWSLWLSDGEGSSPKRLPGSFGPLSGLRWYPGRRQIGMLEVSAESWHLPASQPIASRSLGHLRDGLGAASSFRRRLLRVDVDSGDVEELVGGDFWVDSFSWSHDGRLAFCAAPTVSLPSQVPNQPGTVRPLALYVADEDGSSARQLAPPEQASRCPTFTLDGGEILFLGLRTFAPGLLRLFSVPASGGDARLLIAGFDRGIVPGGDGGGGALLPTARGDVVFAAREGGSFKVFRATPAPTGRVHTLAGSETESFSRLSGSSTADRLIAVATNSRSSQSIVILEPARSASRVVASRRDLPDDVRTPEPIAFTAPDEMLLHGWLLRGAARDRHPPPLLVDVHGGSFSGAWMAQPDLSRLYQQELCERGWNVLLLNARGSDGYGEAFATAAVGGWGTADAPDYHAVLDELELRGACDPNQVAVTGYSYGGFMSNWLTATSGRFRAAVAGGSICNFVSLAGTSDMGVLLTETDAGVAASADPAEALRRSPIALAAGVRTPTLLLHGADDLRCPIAQAEEWFVALSRARCEVELVRYSGAAHGFLSEGPPAYVIDYGRRLVDWVTRHAAPQGASGSAARSQEPSHG